MEKHFKVLRIVGTVYKVVGIIIAVVTLLSALGFCGMSVLGGVVGGVLFSLVIILGGGIYAVTIYALGEAVYLLIALEENTRRTAALLLHSEHEHHEALVPPPQA
jgi:hypothetical protein